MTYPASARLVPCGTSKDIISGDFLKKTNAGTESQIEECSLGLFVPLCKQNVLFIIWNTAPYLVSPFTKVHFAVLWMLRGIEKLSMLTFYGSCDEHELSDNCRVLKGFNCRVVLIASVFSEIRSVLDTFWVTRIKCGNSIVGCISCTWQKELVWSGETLDQKDIADLSGPAMMLHTPISRCQACKWAMGLFQPWLNTCCAFMP